MLKSIKSVPRFHNPKDSDDSRNGDADDSQLTGDLAGGIIVTYGKLEGTAQKFAKSLLDVWRDGDKDGRPFHFPKCDLHVDTQSFKDEKANALLDYAFEIASENGSVYFMFDRGSDAVLAQCCRLKEKIEDKSMLKNLESLRFVGAQNVTINLSRAALKARHSGGGLEEALQEIDSSMELALKAHLQKKTYIQELLDTNGSPLRGAGIASDDGKPYIDVNKATYIFGMIGLNEAVQLLTGQQLHEGEGAYRTGLEIIAHMYGKINEFKRREGLKFTLEETPAESTTRRLAKIDASNKQYGELARTVIKGTKENPYYTNSVHFAPDADVGLVDRIVGQSRFHDMIASGAIVHAWVGEERPHKDVIRGWVENTLYNTRCSQFVVSPTYTECDACGNVMPGEKDLCNGPECSNSNEGTVDKKTLSSVTRIVGYNSRKRNWNGSQQEIDKARKSAEGLYAGGMGRDMGWLYNPNGHERPMIIQFGKHGCVACESLQKSVVSVMKEKGMNGDVDYRVFYLDDFPRDGLVLAAMYDVPLDTVPTLVVANRDSYIKKTTQYAAKGSGQRSDLIRSEDIRSALEGVVEGKYSPAK